MSRKRFLIWGLGLIHAYLILWAIGLYLMLSKIIPSDLFVLKLSALFALTLFFGFGVLLWKRFKTTGRRKLTLIWCTLFYVVAWLFTVIFVALYPFDIIFYEAAHDKFFSHIRTWHENGGSGPLWTPMQKIEYILVGQIPSRYFGIWPLFALLWFGSRDPKAPLPFFGKTKSKRASKRNTGEFAHV